MSDECLKWKPENAGVYQWPKSFFLLKVVRPEVVNQVTALEAFSLNPACQGKVAPHALCPVRALKAHVECTRPLQQAHTQLLW